MDFFERAHVPKKSSSNMENKPNETVKRQLKQMMSAYKQGSNQDILNSAVLKPKFDLEETISMSDFSEPSDNKDVDSSMEAVTSNASDDLQSTSNASNTSESSSSDTDDDNQELNSEDITECCEEFKALSTTMDDSVATSFENSSAVSESGSNDSELSSPSSSRASTSSGTDISEENEFDADGTLAFKILENLERKDSVSKKRKVPKHVELELSKDANKTKEKSVKEGQIKNRSKKLKHGTLSNSTEYFVEEDVVSDLQSCKQTHLDSHDLKKETILKNTTSVTTLPQKQSPSAMELRDDSIDLQSSKQTHLDSHDLKKETILKNTTSVTTLPQKQSHSAMELSDDSIDSTTTRFSSPFVSISAENMPSQSFSELLGEYVHPTIRNISEKFEISTKTTANMFPTGKMFIKDVIDDEISSLIPEVDEDLAVEDLNLDTDTQELIEASDAFNDSVIEDMAESLPIGDITTESILYDDTTTDYDVAVEEAVPLTLYKGKEKHILVMKHPAEIYIHGKVQLADINGMVEILGYKLNYDSIDVYAPYYSYAYCLKTLENPHLTNPDLYNELISVGLSRSDAAEILSTVEANTAVIILGKLNSRIMDFVDSNFSTTDLFSKRCDSTPCFLKKAADDLGCSFYLKPPKKSFEKKAIWDDVYAISRDKSRGIVCGGKGVGKSTFLRHYVNTLLARGPVLVIDLDPGQAEFTMPGSISATVVEKPLIGPNFTHLKTPERMLNIGIINTMDNAKRYLSAVRDLFAFCRATEEFQSLPWIVNTMGLCNHMGLKFMTAIILRLEPTFLFQIDSKVPKKRYEVQLTPPAIMEIYKHFSTDKSFRIMPPNFLEYSFITDRDEEVVPLKGNVASGLLPRDDRYLNILAYFGKLLNERTRGILEIIPYEVNLRDFKIGLNVKIPRDMVAEVINGKIIALCQQNAHDKGQVFTLEDKALLCHGHGLIRSIDLKQGIAYILTPTHLNKLHLVDTFVYSDWMPELRGLERDLPKGTAVPFRTANIAVHHRKLMFPPRRRFNPIQLLNMSRNS